MHPPLPFKLSVPNREGPLAVLEPMSSDAPDFLSSLISHREFLHELLIRHGAIHFKGFGAALDSFDAFMGALFPELPAFNAKRAGIFSNRKALKKNVLESTYLGPRIPLACHNEFSYLPEVPQVISFLCLEAPEEGGETTLSDCRAIYRELNPSIRSEFEEKQIRYERNLYEQRLLSRWVNELEKIDEGWPEVFRTNSKVEVEAICRENGVECRWRPNHALNLQNTLPAVRFHPKTGEPVWFNQAAHWVGDPRVSGWIKFCVTRLLYPTRTSRPIQVRFGDGSEIPVSYARHIFEVSEKNTVSMRWRVGDTVVCDNYLVGHGRRPYRGKRTLAAAMR